MSQRDTHERNGHKGICRCGHALSWHARGKECLACDSKTARYCACKRFEEAKSKGRVA